MEVAMPWGVLASLLLALLTMAVPGRVVAASEAPVIDLTGAIGPAAAAFVAKEIDRAAEARAPVLVLRMDTPGGLDTAMRDIVKAVVASPVPVVGFVAPSGARAASAGTYILYACHLAAMAPGTNLGAATPVQLGGLGAGGAGEGDEDGGNAKTDKLVNDAVAYIRSLAELRGRNAEWAEQAVRGAASLSASRALELGVIDLMAEDVPSLLAAVDGRVVETKRGEMVLVTAGTTPVVNEPDWRIRVLGVVSNPSVAYILLLIGIYGLIYEFANPGAVLPGTVGAVSLVLALYAFQLLPVNYAGALLMLLGLALMVAEAFVPSFGALGVAGVAAFVVGSMILVDTDVPGYGLSIPLILAFAVASALLLMFVIGVAVRSRRRGVVSGAEQLIGATGRALSGFPGEGAVHLRGETWTARSDQPIAPGQAVRVVGRDGLTLIVTPQTTEKEP